jgi:hypothetical protein
MKNDLVILIIAIVCVGCNKNGKPSYDTLPAGELLRKWNEQPELTKKKYQGRKIELTGRVGVVETNKETGQIVIRFADVAIIRCVTDDAGGCYEGGRVMIVGDVSFSDSEIEVSNCDVFLVVEY